MNNSRNETVNASVVDLFCGAGGLSHGFYKEQFPIAAGIDIDEDCRYAYESNNEAPFIRQNVSSLNAEELNRIFYPNTRKVLVGCAPCQPFSAYNQKNSDPTWRLLRDFGSLINLVRPDVVSMENVPRLLKFRNGTLFRDFVSTLENAGYSVAWDILFGPEYGLPQTRARLVLLASKLGPISLPQTTHAADHYETVAGAIGSLPPLDAGSIDPNDPMHRCSRLSPLNMQRIRASKPGGTWNDWPECLVATCHKHVTGRGYSSVYGRMVWDKPSPTITTQFYGFGNGRFGHPEQDRALSLREGAILQGFPHQYAFVEPGDEIEFKKLGRMIGNAVPVFIAHAIARIIRSHLNEYA